MTPGVIAGIARHILTAVAGVFAAKYTIDGATIDVIVSGLTAIVGVAWSVWDKKKSA